jgi:hypothetical protein
VGPNPYPKKSLLDINRDRTIVVADTNAPVFADPFELERRMPRIGFEKRIFLVGQVSD